MHASGVKPKQLREVEHTDSHQRSINDEYGNGASRLKALRNARHYKLKQNAKIQREKEQYEANEQSRGVPHLKAVSNARNYKLKWGAILQRRKEHYKAKVECREHKRTDRPQPLANDAHGNGVSRFKAPRNASYYKGKRVVISLDKSRQGKSKLVSRLTAKLRKKRLRDHALAGTIKLRRGVELYIRRVVLGMHGQDFVRKR
jgi:hypothetical protein